MTSRRIPRTNTAAPAPNAGSRTIKASATEWHIGAPSTPSVGMVLTARLGPVVVACDVSARVVGVREIWVERQKWPRAPHYGHAGWILGEDEHGLWLELRVGSPVYRGEEVLFHGTSGGLMLVPPDDGWLAWFPEFGDFELYIDIVFGMTRSESSVTMVDLDLDVIRRRDGSVELLDEDEFALHQVELGYPAQLIQHAERMADHVLSAVRSNVEPFAGAAALEWMTRRTDHS